MRIVSISSVYVSICVTVSVTVAAGAACATPARSARTGNQPAGDRERMMNVRGGKLSKRSRGGCEWMQTRAKVCATQDDGEHPVGRTGIVKPSVEKGGDTQRRWRGLERRRDRRRDI